jgi:Phage minor structural protein GP20
MPRTLFLSPDGGEGGAPPAPAQNDDTAGGKLFERLVGQLDKRDAQLLETLRAEVTASIDARLKTGSDAAEAAARRAIALALGAAAEEAGAHDVETVERLVASDAITVDAAGTISGVKEAIAALKAAKPFLFGARRPTGGTARTPRPGEPKPKSARDLTPAEWQAEKRRLGVPS